MQFKKLLRVKSMIEADPRNIDPSSEPIVTRGTSRDLAMSIPSVRAGVRP